MRPLVTLALVLHAPLAAAAGPELFVARGHHDRVAHLAFSPDGGLLASSGGDKTVRIWDVASGLEIAALGKAGSVRTQWVGFSPDGQRVFAGETMSTAAWSLDDRQVLSFYGLPGDYMTRSYAWVGERLAVRSNKLELYDFASQKVLWSQAAPYAAGVAASRDGAQLALLSSKGSALLDPATGATTAPLPPASYGFFAPDARAIALETSSGLVLVELEGARARPIRGPTRALGFGPDGALYGVVVGPKAHVARIDPTTLAVTPLGRISLPKDDAPLALDPTGTRLAIGDESGAVELRDVGTGAVRWRRARITRAPVVAEFFGDALFVAALRDEVQLGWSWLGRGPPDAVYPALGAKTDHDFLYAVPNADGSRVAVEHYVGMTPTLSLLDTATGRVLKRQRYEGRPLAFDPAGKLLAAAESEKERLVLLDARTLERRSVLGGGAPNVARFTRDGRHLVTPTQVFDVASRRIVAAGTGEFGTEMIASISLDEAESRVAVGGNLNVTTWPMAGGPFHTFRAADGSAKAVALSPDGQHLVVGTWRHELLVYDAAQPGSSERLLAHQEEVTALRFHAGGRWLLSVGRDQTVRLWDFPARKLAATLYLLGERDWVLVTPDGRFDGSPAAIEQLHYVSGRTAVPLSAFYERDFTPRLFEQLLGGETPAPPERALTVPPAVRFATPPPAETEAEVLTVVIEGEDRGGGLAELRLYHDGKLVGDGERGLAKAGPRRERRELQVSLAPGPNRLEPVALSPDQVEARGEAAVVVRRGGPKKGRLFLIAIGVDEYENPKYRLSYSKGDASAFARALTTGAAAMYASVSATELFDRAATRATVEAAFQAAATAAAPEDTLVLFYAGHGVMAETQGGASEFYLVPPDITNLYGDPEALLARGISARRLRELAAAVRAKKQLFVIDACEAGGAVEAFAVRGAAEERAIAQLARSSGVVVLAATGATQFANEVKALGHGIFTHAVLSALAGKADGSPRDGQVTVKELEAYVSVEVPALTEKHRGSRQYPTSFSRGQDFPLGLAPR